MTATVTTGNVLKRERLARVVQYLVGQNLEIKNNIFTYVTKQHFTLNKN